MFDPTEKSYNLALLPVSKKDEFINLANEFKSGADYLLGEFSQPHITLAHFNFTPTENYSIDNLSKEIQKLFAGTELFIQLNKCNAKPDGEKLWLELVIKPNLACQRLHENLVNFLASKKIPCTTKLQLDKYSPHLTLATTTDFSAQEKLLAKNIDIQDTFYLALGTSDKKWQFVKVLYAYNKTEAIECRNNFSKIS